MALPEDGMIGPGSATWGDDWDLCRAGAMVVSICGRWVSLVAIAMRSRGRKPVLGWNCSWLEPEEERVTADSERESMMPSEMGEADGAG
jgi:hypothetical protein